ncbi:hypothetical protein EDE12_11165 [Methylosinus sp. sav-2]|uniref:hypothetical protein n=1 Tax=Methylosinus sp. sav-2 TaxID=2485168 RepID=UPI00047E57E3|nr:hypothetical protein [Methylosinus sp. sav-2]TDX62159.1 hypothetical protein EDE12_11165 [Methylosinus sp. sav-2]
MAVSEQTISAYLIRTSRLRRRCACTLLIDVAALQWTEFVAWLIMQRPQWSRSTWRTYKRAIVEVMTREHPDERAALAALDAATQTEAKKKTGRTSAAKSPRFGPDERERIFAALRLGRSPRALELIDFISATIAAGLRPTEWRGATLEVSAEGAVRLLVKNAKATNGRAHGPHRTLHWPNLPPETLAAMSRTIAIAQKFSSAAEYDAHRKALQDLLGALSRRLWPNRAKHFALYSCRREFIAQAKMVYSPVEVAALVGHSVDRTAQSHYGRVTKSSGGRDITLPIPDPDDVARVRENVAPRLAALSRLHREASKKAKSREVEGSHDAAPATATPFAESSIAGQEDAAAESPRSAEGADADAPSIAPDAGSATSIAGPAIDLTPEPPAQADEAEETSNLGERLQIASRDERPIPDSGDGPRMREIVAPIPAAPSRAHEGSHDTTPAAAAPPIVANHEAAKSQQSAEGVDAAAPSEGPTLDPFPEPPSKAAEKKKARDEGGRLWQKFQTEQRRSLDDLPSGARHEKKGSVRELDSVASSSDGSPEGEPKPKDIP